MVKSNRGGEADGKRHTITALATCDCACFRKRRVARLGGGARQHPGRAYGAAGERSAGLLALEAQKAR